MFMLASLPECEIMLAKRVKALKALWRDSTTPEVQRPLSLLCVWDGGVFKELKSCVFGVFFLLLSHRSLGRCTEPLEQRL